jgi:hypothetical protein
MSVSTARGQIYSALKDLRVLWQLTREQWDDVVAREFQERFWLPLEGNTVSAVAALDRLGQVLSQIKQDCGDSETTYHDEEATE